MLPPLDMTEISVLRAVRALKDVGLLVRQGQTMGASGLSECHPREAKRDGMAVVARAAAMRMVCSVVFMSLLRLEHFGNMLLEMAKFPSAVGTWAFAATSSIWRILHGFILIRLIW